jgi:hypothetical protein
MKPINVSYGEFHVHVSPGASLRVEGFAALAASFIAYWFLGGNWWVFAVLLLAPDLAFIAYTAGAKTGARVYNLAHNYAVPAVLGAIGWFGAVPLLVELALIWTAHIGADRALGYGLKYPGYDHQTHLGPIGKARKLADTR